MEYRPLVHFSPKRNWMNDPNGLVYLEGEWHLFFQYNPHGNVWGHMSWGHAVSRDLLHWEELPLALPEDAEDMIFSGSCVVDWHNSAGFGAGAQPVLVACYTAHAQDGAYERQCLAYSHDKGRTWEKYAGNPVLDIGLKDFRDPKLFWREQEQRWVMLVSQAAANILSFYASTDLKNWTHMSDFAGLGPDGRLWECPDILELPVEGGGTHWLLKVDVFEEEHKPKSVALGFTGHFDGERFTADGDWQYLDYGADFYASASWSNAPDGRAIWIGWMNSHHYAKDTPTQGWRGAMTLPREVRLRRAEADAQGNAYHVMQKPVVQLKPQPVLTTTPFALTWEAEGAQDMELVLEWAGVAGAAAKEGEGQAAQSPARVKLHYDAASKAYVLERGESGAFATHAHFTPRFTAPRLSRGARHHVQIMCDSCSLEIFTDEGATVFTALVFPPEGQVAARVSHGTLTSHSIEAAI
jgi:fructan beta-fructosidase